MRKFRRARFRRKPVQRVNYAWETAMFNEAALQVNTTTVANICWDTPLTVFGSGALGPTSQYRVKVRRWIFSGGITWSMADTGAFGRDSAAFMWIAHAIDKEEPLTNIWANTTISDPLNEWRIARVGVMPVLFQDMAAAAPAVQVLGGFTGDCGINAFRIDFDIKLNWWLRPDDEMSLTVQTSQDLSVGTGSSILSEARLFGLSKILYERP